jgi:hypothetical protein
MSFADPTLLWLLLLLIVPLVLYLLPMPRRRMATSALYLWERFLGTERFGRTSERFRRALGFALMMAILVCLILAAADLMLGTAPAAAGRVVVLMDNSGRLGAVVDGQRENFGRARDAMREMVRSLPSATELTIAEAGDDLHVIYPTGPGGAGAAEAVETIRPFEGPVDLARALEQAWQSWGAKDGEVYVFSDRALPASSWGGRAHLWLAPAAGDNVGITAIHAARRGGEITVNFSLSNFGAARTVSGKVLCNKHVHKSFDLALEAGQTLPQAAGLDEPGEALIEVRLEKTGDCLAADDAAFARVPSAADMTVGVAWPEGNKRNDYVVAVLAALEKEGAISGFSESTACPVAVYVNHAPEAWKEGGAIVLYPLRSGLIEIPGMLPQEVAVSRQAQDELLKDVDLAGLTVTGAVRSTVPAWAKPLVWADDVPLVWAGQTGKTKVMFVGIPVMPIGTRLPLVASFPALMRNALQWMLPAPQSCHPGQLVEGWTSRTCGLVGSPADGRIVAFSLASAESSNLRRGEEVKGEATRHRHSAAKVLVAMAGLLLMVEWGLFHRRLTL